MGRGTTPVHASEAPLTRLGGPCTAALACGVPVSKARGETKNIGANDMTITLALSKGRIFEETLPLLAAAGIEVLEDPEKSRKLILPTNQPDVRVVLVRASDVPTMWNTAARIWA